MAKKKSQQADAAQTSADHAMTSIEDAMTELAEIVAQLESGQESLDASLLQFERGMTLLRLCHRKLDYAAQRIEIVTRMSEGDEVELEEFDGTASLQRKTRPSPEDKRSPANRTRTEARQEAEADGMNEDADQSSDGRSLF